MQEEIKRGTKNKLASLILIVIVVGTLISEALKQFFIASVTKIVCCALLFSFMRWYKTA